MVLSRLAHKSSFWARSATVNTKRDRTSASEGKLDVRAGSYHTRPEYQANDFERLVLANSLFSLRDINLTLGLNIVVSSSYH